MLGQLSPDEVVAGLRRFHYDADLLPDPHVLQSARRAYGIDRLVFGSDSPNGTPAGAIACSRRSNDRARVSRSA